MVPTIINHVRSIGQSHHMFEQPSKLVPKHHLFSFILCIKHDNVIKHMLSCGIAARVQKMIMAYLLCLASILPILMNIVVHCWRVIGFGSILSTHIGYIWFIDGAFIKITSFETIHPIIIGLKGRKKCIA